MGRYSMKDVGERRALAASIIEPILQGKRDRTVKTIYKRLEANEDGRIRTVLLPDTASFRLSSGESLLYENSTNLQNIPKKVARLDPLYQARDIFVAPKGWTFLAGDYKGAEALMVAAYSRDWQFMEDLMAGKDVHTEHALHFFRLSDISLVTSLQRDIAKTITYSSFYRAQPPTITINMNKEADTTGIYMTVQEVADLRAVLLQLHPLERWWDETRRELTKSGGVAWNTFGYKRTFHDSNDDNRLKDCLSFYPQSTVACLMNMALPKLFADLDNTTSVQIVHQVHDELLWLVREGYESHVIKRATPYLERPFRIHDRELYIPVEWKVGRVWGQMKQHKGAPCVSGPVTS